LIENTISYERGNDEMIGFGEIEGGQEKVEL